MEGASNSGKLPTKRGGSQQARGGKGGNDAKVWTVIRDIEGKKKGKEMGGALRMAARGQGMRGKRAISEEASGKEMAGRRLQKN